MAKESFQHECVCGATFRYVGVETSAIFAWGVWIGRHTALYPEEGHEPRLTRAERMVMDALFEGDVEVEALWDNSDYADILDGLRLKLVLNRVRDPSRN